MRAVVSWVRTPRSGSRACTAALCCGHPFPERPNADQKKVPRSIAAVKSIIYNSH